MGGRKKKTGGKKQQHRKKGPSAASVASKNDDRYEEWLNFVLEAGPGCHMAHKLDGDAAHNDNNNNGSASSMSDWVLEWEQVDPDDFAADSEDDGEENDNGQDDDDDDDENQSMTSNRNIPDLAIDPDKGTLTLCNVRSDFVVAYISVFDRTLRGRNNNHILQAGSTTSEDGKTSTSCTTLIVLCPPCTFCHLCYITSNNNSHHHHHHHHTAADTMQSLEDLQIESDVQVWNRHPNPNDTHPRCIGFPLQTTDETDGAFLCTQGEGGKLTHFFAGNLHAIDFRCPIGTPLLAVGDGVVVEAKDRLCHLTGVAVSNLFSWNSILIQLDDATNTKSAGDYSDDTCSGQEGNAINNDEAKDESHRLNNDEFKDGPLLVEYVHISSSSVQAGDRVTKGQVIGESGSVGFSPEPHLHFAAYRSTELTAPTVRVYFEASLDGDPKGGANPKGETQDQPSSTKSDNDVSRPSLSTPSMTHFLPKAGRWYNHTGQVRGVQRKYQHQC